MRKSLFVQVFGDYPMIRVIDFLIENDVFDYSKTQISNLSGVSFNTLELLWKDLIKFKIIKKTRRLGKSDMYQLNKENPLVQKILEMDKKLMLESIKKVKIPVKVSG